MAARTVLEAQAAFDTIAWPDSRTERAARDALDAMTTRVEIDTANALYAQQREQIKPRADEGLELLRAVAARAVEVELALRDGRMTAEEGAAEMERLYSDPQTGAERGARLIVEAIEQQRGVLAALADTWAYDHKLRSTYGMKIDVGW